MTNKEIHQNLTCGYMLVDAVTRYMSRNKLAPLQVLPPQYEHPKIKNMPSIFFKCEDVKQAIGAAEFRTMEYNVTTHHFLKTDAPQPVEEFVTLERGGPVQ